MSLHCGIDLHSNNQVVVAINDNDKALVERRVPNRSQMGVRTLSADSEWQEFSRYRMRRWIHLVCSLGNVNA